jgi:hypothetical protein
VDEKMKFDMQSKLEEYLKLLEQIKQRTTDERTAVSLLQEMSKDRRSVEIRDEREARSSDTNNSEASNREAEAVYEEAGNKIPCNSDQARGFDAS